MTTYNIPHGWKLVPVEPTEEMIEAGAEGSGEDSRDCARGAYKAMLAAVPERPVEAQWRDISSAPKDGTHFLAYDPAVKECDVCHMVESIYDPTRYSCESLQCDGLHGPFEDEFNYRRATYWMPLPAPPDAEESTK